MSTRSYICKELRTTKKTGNVLGIYCHYDGYIEHNGYILSNYYNTKEKVNELMALGNLSSLAEHPSPKEGETHCFEEPFNDVCIAYGRDRHEKGQKAKKVELKTILTDGWIEYVYLYTLKGEWQLVDINGKGEIVYFPIFPDKY